MPEIVRRYCPHTILGYSLLVAALLLLPAIATAARVNGAIEYTIETAAISEQPSAFSEEDRVALQKHLKATKKKDAVELDYRLGGYLPDDVGYKELPAKLVKKLDELPDGYAAVRIGNDVVLISELSRQVIDVVIL